MAITLDGKIAKSSEHFPDWTGKADKKFFMERTKQAGCLVMGSKTYDTIGRPLPERKNVIMTRNPDRESEQENLEFTKASPQEIIKKLSSKNFQEVILAGGAQINTLWARAGLIDEIILTISPLVFGEGIGIFSEAVDLDLQLKSLTKLDENLVCVHYKVIKQKTNRSEADSG